jgi:hypothetical protein
MVKPINMLDYNLNWNEYFELNESSPSGLVRIKNYHGKLIEKYNVGTKMFQKNGDPLGWRLKFKGTLYLVHRIIWVLTHNGLNTDLIVDHLDGNPFNNQINNLQPKTQTNNTRNARRRIDNTTGSTGILLDNKGNGNFYYTARWSEMDGSLKVKNFSVSKLGEENAKALAIAYREQQIARLISEGANYTDRHGN